ncbi:hypothetical protein LMG29739_02401 [Paraburkholderia solisilvae]|uniref:Uncharacterized protein n=1 Tax=Paraburkholderia solisilvae TaxID=624376 RepID=A0A6J5DQS4_9BURK|nr:hypothetical protein LMG29739_02401 [Paraburkholderia solisilvae]
MPIENPHQGYAICVDLDPAQGVKLNLMSSACGLHRVVLVRLPLLSEMERSH